MNKLLIVDLAVDIGVHLLDQLLHKVVLSFSLHWEEEACDNVHLQRSDEAVSILEQNCKIPAMVIMMMNIVNTLGQTQHWAPVNWGGHSLSLLECVSPNVVSA